MGYFFIGATVVLVVLGQFLIKWQVARLGPPSDEGDRLFFLLTLLLNPWVLAGLAAAFGASLFWMLALAKLPLSHAYPFTAISYVAVVLGGAWLFSEPIGWAKLLGVGLIVAGVITAGLE